MIDNRDEEEDRGPGLFPSRIRKLRPPTGCLHYFRLISVFLKVFSELPVIQGVLNKKIN